MSWNWQQPDWPQWHYDAQSLEALEQQFLLGAGGLIGAWQHLMQADQAAFQVELLSGEALKTSEIEGEILDRVSVQSSVRREFGLLAASSSSAPSSPQESGIAELMVACFRDFGRPLQHQSLFQWHKLVCRGHSNLRVIGAYRTHTESIQVVSGAIYRPKVHFEAPPSEAVNREMTSFIEWFDNVRLPALAKAALAQLYFVSIHPFEDGNGRIGRALSEKVFAQALGQPSLIALSRQIEKKRKGYYQALESNNKSMDVTAWVLWFAETALEAQQYSMALIKHVIAKARLFDRLREQLNPRQKKVLLRLFEAGPERFIGGLSAANYRSITKASPATVGRDLTDLVAKKALFRTGEKKGTRYWLNL